uniref:Similar to Os07g0681600 n=1 Tax=Arundo donax TaxID=35708 RepID=A0A0A9EB48_ARUDO
MQDSSKKDSFDKSLSFFTAVQLSQLPQSKFRSSPKYCNKSLLRHVARRQYLCAAMKESMIAFLWVPCW